MSSELALLRHSQPAIESEKPAHQWTLTDEGRRRSTRIAALLTAWRPDRILSSSEPKAVETAELIASHLGLSCAADDGFGEHSRHTAPFYVSRAEFERRLEDLFREPDRVAFGEESALVAAARFRESLERVRRRCPEDRLAVVTHGTVMSLYLAEVTGESAWQLWKRWTTPCLVTVDPTAGCILTAVSWDGTAI